MFDTYYCIFLVADGGGINNASYKMKGPAASRLKIPGTNPLMCSFKDYQLSEDDSHRGTVLERSTCR